MSITERLRNATPEDMSRDVLEFFGVQDGQPFAWNGERVEIGGEAVSTVEVMAAIRAMDDNHGQREVYVGDLVDD